MLGQATPESSFAKGELLFVATVPDEHADVRTNAATPRPAPIRRTVTTLDPLSLTRNVAVPTMRRKPHPHPSRVPVGIEVS
jgi:hypothetical protein